MHGLRWGQGWVQPDLIAGLKVGHAGDGQRHAGAGDVNLDGGTGKVETRLGTSDRGKAEQGNGSEAVRQTSHSKSLDGAAPEGMHPIGYCSALERTGE